MGSEWKSEPVLRLIAGSTPARTFPIPTGILVVGRNKDCDVVLDGDTRISKRHMEVRRDGDAVYLKDLKSTNKTAVNGDYLEPFVEHRLRDGDHIKVCEHLFSYHSSLVALSNDDDHSKILGSIEVASSSRLIAKFRTEERLRAILEISRELGNTLHLREVLEKTLGSLFKIFPQAERGFILLRKDGSGTPVLQAIRHREGADAAVTVSTTVFAHVMERGNAILSENLVDDSRFVQARSLQGSEIRTMMGVPLLDQDRVPIGMIQIDTRDQRSKFSQEDLDLLASVAGPVGLAVENAGLHEDLLRFASVRASLQNAREVQLAMLPACRPDVPGYEFWDFYEPAESVGGDYYDYLPVRGHDDAPLLAVTLGDVSGKGMPAALLMAKLTSEVRFSLLTDTDLPRAITALNKRLADAKFPERFITLIGTVLDPVAHRVAVVKAGHIGPMIRRASGQVELVSNEGGGPPLAIFESTRYSAQTLDLAPGDVVLLYTDGVDEAMNPEGECLKTERLRRAVRAARGDAAGVGMAVIEAVRQHAAGCPQSDDIGIVCFGRPR